MYILEAENVHSYYGGAHVLHGVSLQVPKGHLVALLGRNGTGKTSFLVKKAPHYISKLGIGLVPQGRRIFRSLTVTENLVVPARKGTALYGKTWDLERIWKIFPRLAERKHHYGNQISGGEQQMLAIGRALMTNPSLLVMDEPSEGLAPLLVQQLRQQILQLKAEGLSMLLVEQQLGLALVVADDVFILERGTVVYQGTPAELQAKPDIMHRYLGV